MICIQFNIVVRRSMLKTNAWHVMFTSIWHKKFIRNYCAKNSPLRHDRFSESMDFLLEMRQCKSDFETLWHHFFMMAHYY